MRRLLVGGLIAACVAASGCAATGGTSDTGAVVKAIGVELMAVELRREVRDRLADDPDRAALVADVADRVAAAMAGDDVVVIQALRARIRERIGYQDLPAADQQALTDVADIVERAAAAAVDAHSPVPDDLRVRLAEVSRFVAETARATAPPAPDP